MSVFQVRVDAKDANGLLSSLGRQLPFATALALTRTASKAKDAVVAEMPRVFDRPTSWTLNAVRYDRATPKNLTAFVRFKDWVAPRSADSGETRYAHLVFGGERRGKRFEGLLRKAGLLGNNEQAVPGEAARLDEFGNMQVSQIREILSWFQAYPDVGSKQNSTIATRARKAKGTRTRRGRRFFLKRDGRGRGIYEATSFVTPGVREGTTRTEWAIRPVLMFVRRGNYSTRLNVPEIVRQTIESSYAAEFDRAAAQAIRTARR